MRRDGRQKTKGVQVEVESRGEKTFGEKGKHRDRGGRMVEVVEESLIDGTRKVLV